MRLHHLAVTAFGPFPGTVEVDFDRLSPAGLFLIHGATGSGKTSLLDAICFALYAAVPGPRPGGRALRSDHAPPDVAPSVTLEFTTSERRFRITRSPELLRAKRRGTGQTRTPARVTLEELVGGQWATRSSRNDEAAEVVKDLLGMGLEQFSKVVLLPQGEFAAFLRSTPEDRRAVLEKLFDVGAFTGVEEWLANERRAGAGRLDRARQDLTADLARLGDVVGGVPPSVLAEPGAAPGTEPPDWASLPVDELPPLLARVGRRLGAHAAQALAVYDAATSAERVADAAKVRAQRVADLQQRAARAAAELASLDERRTEEASTRARVAAAERAAACAGDLRALRRAEDAVAAASHALEAADGQVARFGVAGWSVEAVRAWCESLAEGGATLAEAQRLERTVAERAGRIAELVAAGSRLAREVRRKAEEVERCARTMAALADERVELEAVLGGAAEVRAAAAELTLRIGHRRELDSATAALARLGDAVRAARTAEQDAREASLDRRQARLDGMAGELARRLGDGAPCPVCGSVDHPAPAPTGVVVTAEDVDGAEAAWAARRAELDRLVQEQAVHQRVVATRTADLTGEQRSAEELLGAASRAAADLERVTSAQLSLAGVLEAEERAAARASEQAAEQDALLREQAAAAATLGELRRGDALDRQTRTALVASHTGCPCLADPAAGPPAGTLDPRRPVTLAALLRHHEDTLTAAGGYLARLTEQVAARAEQVRVAALVADVLAAHGFGSAEEAAAARVEEGELMAIRRRLKADDDVRAAAQATLADPDVVAAQGLPAPDVAAAVSAADRARSGQLQAREDQALADGADREFRRVAELVEERLSALGSAAAGHEVLAQLADTVNGLGQDNTLRMRLSSFVLAARLEKVADLANERLAVMGDGRYQLRHSDGLAGRGQRSGLGLVVNDLWTGQTRDTSTLSGGESFMASLALALGLADAVREEAGGLDLQTLFIDEGFGSLDDDSLEQVMAVLDGLREGGRAVGVVSHVGDLRARIPCQISVDKRASGSTVRVVGLGSPAA